ncbi:MAG: aromatic ring-hydroxylating oxygenase subunit alpha [Planctomycetota bacterium]
MLIDSSAATVPLAEVQPGYALPRAFYTADAVFQADLERVYARHWLFAGPAARIPREGDFFTLRLAGAPLIVLRGRDGRVQALHNVCRHRGSVVCNAEQGRAKGLVCPYHQWVYGLDGALLNARRMPEDLDKSQLGLKSAHLREVAGLLFVCLAKKPPPFDELAAAFTTILAPHGLNDAQIAVRRTYTLEANWKLVVENSRECYHCQFGHPEYSAMMLADPARPEHGRACALHDQERREHYARLGLSTAPALGANYKLSRYPFMQPGAVSESADGRAVAPVMGTLADPDAGVVGGYVFPNLQIECSSDYAVLFRFVPLAPTRTVVEATWLVRAGSVEGRDFDPARVTWFWRTTGEQDWKLCEDNQAGVNSPFFEPGPLAPEEHDDIGRFHRWYLEQLHGIM